MNSSLVVRLALVTLAFLQGALSRQVIAPPGDVSASLLAAIVLFSMAGMLLVIGIQRLNPESATIWRYPRWSINPFTLREPLQLFHLGGYFFIAVGVGSTFRRLLMGHPLSLSVLFAPAIGAGILAGVYACTIAYRGKMEAGQSS